MAEGPAIRATQLAKRYGERTALAGVDIEVSYGEVFAYLGRNGSGKTTTVRVLTGLSSPSSGQAWIDGRPLPDIDRSLMGVTLQAAALDDAMTGREHLRFLAALWDYEGPARRRVVDDHLERFELADAADRLIGTYSGGMKRRLDLAGALIHRPRVLFLDEPTTGLDAQSRRALWDTVRSLRREGTAIFLTTQYLEEADRLADRVAILDSGRIAVKGTPQQLREGLGGVELSIALVGGIPETRAIRLPDGRILPTDSGGIARVAVADASEALDVLNYVRSMWLIRSARIETPTLEDVFLEVTGRTVSESHVVLDSVA